MRRGNLPDGGHDKITWKRIRDLLTRRRDNVTLRRGGDVPQRRYLPGGKEDISQKFRLKKKINK